MQRWWEEERSQFQARVKIKDNIMSAMEVNIIEMEAKWNQLKETMEGQVYQIKEMEQKIIFLEISKYSTYF